MITAVNEQTYDLRCLSTDGFPHGPNVTNWDSTTKINIANGSTLFLIDKGTVYMYSITEDATGAATGTWIAL